MDEKEKANKGENDNTKKVEENQENKTEEKKEIKLEEKKEEIKNEIKDDKKEIKDENDNKKVNEKNNEEKKEEQKNKEEKTKREDNTYKESTEPFMQIVSKELIEIIKNPENQKCFDCEASPAYWLCVNNAIFLCSKCAGEHRGYGTIISNLKFMMLDKLNEFQIAIMKRGGNDKLNKLLKEYNVDKKKIDKLILYSSKLLEYHRDYLYNKLAGKKDPKPPTKYESNKIMDNFKDNPRPPLEKIKTKEDIFTEKENNDESDKDMKKGNCRAQ